MKIAIISPWAVTTGAVGGTERFIVDLAESLVTRGQSATVYMFDGFKHTKNKVHYIPIHLLGEYVAINEYSLKEHLGDFSQLKTYEALAQKVERLIDVSSYDAIHINTQLLIRAWPTMRRLFTIHTNPFEYKQAWGDDSYATMIDLARKEALNPKTTFAAPSKYYATYFSQKIESPVIPIPHAITPVRITSLKDKHILCGQYGLDETKIHILLPSRLEPTQKQPGLLFDSLTSLPAQLISRIEILSSGLDMQYEKHRQQYEEQAKSLGCSVYFGQFENMSDAYELADIVVLPSKSESFGYSALESLTLGIPTILNNIPTFHEIAEGHPSATFFENKDELAATLVKLLNHNILRHTPSRQWSERYSIDAWALKYEELL